MSWYFLLVVCSLAASVWGHGRVLEPPSRASAWRRGFDTPANYDDDGLNCGGFSNQWIHNNGKCGICGDPYEMPSPRDHELGGIYGDGVIVAHYHPGSLFTATVQLTTYHRGFWELKICTNPEDNEQDCFDQYPVELEDGGTRFYPKHGSTTYNVTYRLPPGLVCDHCVLQWRYTAGNNWGICPDGTGDLGCGNQEQFGACSDISIGASSTYNEVEPVEGYEEMPYPLLHYLKHGYFDFQQGGNENEIDNEIDTH